MIKSAQANEAMTELCAAAGCAVPPNVETTRRAVPAPFPGKINRTYFLVRRAMAILAVALPVILWAATAPWPNPSISEYYHHPGNWTRDLFVATLCTVGFSLFFYRGYSELEDWVLSAAGVAAAGVAFAPMPCETTTNGLCASAGLFSAHGAFAIGLFLCMSYVCIFLSSTTLNLLKDEKKRARYRLHYRTIGALMVAVPIGVFVLHLLWKGAGQSHIVFALETAGIWIFAAYWLVKSSEIKTIVDQRS